MSDSVHPFIGQFNEIVEECQVFRFVTRDSDLQKRACDKLQNLLTQVAAEKQSAIAAGDEDFANVLLGCQCVARALFAEIKMWLLIKEARADEAWDELVAAQDNLTGAVRAHEGFAHMLEHAQTLDAIEHIVFPPQVFLSSGMIVKNQTCSICGEEYDDCEHVKGRPYMGSFCTVTLTPSALDHVSIVDNPADKRCRITKFSAEGGYRNRMTWLVDSSDKASQEGTTTNPPASPAPH